MHEVENLFFFEKLSPVGVESYRRRYDLPVSVNSHAGVRIHFLINESSRWRENLPDVGEICSWCAKFAGLVCQRCAEYSGLDRK
jgi:hypothetical protein